MVPKHAWNYAKAENYLRRASIRILSAFCSALLARRIFARVKIAIDHQHNQGNCKQQQGQIKFNSLIQRKLDSYDRDQCNNEYYGYRKIGKIGGQYTYFERSRDLFENRYRLPENPLPPVIRL